LLAVSYQYKVLCYNLKLALDYNLGKDLSKRVGMSQLVKCKDTGLYLQLYIPINNEAAVWFIYVNDITDNKE